MHGATSIRRSLNTFHTGGGYGGYGYRGFGGAGMGIGSATATESEYTVGTLVNTKTKTMTLVYRTSASDELSDKTDKDIKEAGQGFGQDVQELPEAACPKAAGLCPVAEGRFVRRNAQGGSLPTSTLPIKHSMLDLQG